MLSIGYWTPITPVDPMMMSVESAPIAFAISSVISLAFASPVSPVATLAFLEITAMALVVGDAVRCSRDT